jgi:hypothetical protein
VRRLGRVLAAIVVLAAGGFGLLAVVSARDDAEIAAPVSAPGEPAEGACTDASAQIGRDRGPLSDTQVARALELGNVVILAPRPGALAELQEEVSGPFDAELAAAGQMVILGRSDGPPITALAFDRRLEAASPDDPALREFAERLLGNGAGRDCG